MITFYGQLDTVRREYDERYSSHTALFHWVSYYLIVLNDGAAGLTGSSCGNEYYSARGKAGGPDFVPGIMYMI